MRLPRGRNKGVTLAEMMLVILFISILAIVIVPSFVKQVADAKQEADQTNVANINALVQLFFIKEDTWPLTNLSDIATNIIYFPDASLPTCPVTPSSSYTLNVNNHRVTGHLRASSTHP